MYVAAFIFHHRVLSCLLYILPTEPPAPSGVSVTRVSDTVIRVEWQPLSLVEARGHIRYRVMVTSTTANKRKRQSTQGERMCTLMSPCDVPANESSVLVGGLDRDTSYSVTVMAVNSENEDGPASLPMIVTGKMWRIIVVLCMLDKIDFIFLYQPLLKHQPHPLGSSLEPLLLWW